MDDERRQRGRTPRDDRHQHGRPPWWPEDEPFPPFGERWSEMRRSFLRRVAIGVGAVFVFFMVLGWIGWAVFGGWEHGPRERGPFPGFFLLVALIVVGFVAIGRAVRRTTRPIADVMDAAARLREGDLSARARESGPRDVRDLARSFNAMAERLESDESRRRNLLADVTHELRTPLAVIRGRVEGLRDGLYEGDEHLALIEEETQVMARLLDDLQLLSNAEAGALTLHRERVSASELVDAAVAAHRPSAEAAGIALDAVVGSEVPDIDVDRVRIGEVLSNLLTNAIRHTPRGGAIVVRAIPDPAGVAFEVADTGEGIATAELTHVFDRFAKSDASHGSGLGLAIARGLVRAHGGDISASSEVGSGTTIRFALPRA